MTNTRSLSEPLCVRKVEAHRKTRRAVVAQPAATANTITRNAETRTEDGERQKVGGRSIAG